MSKNQSSLKELKNLLGEELFRSVTETLAGQRIVFPKNPDWSDMEDRNRKIRQDYEAGKPVPVLVKQFGLSQSQIYKIIGKMS